MRDGAHLVIALYLWSTKTHKSEMDLDGYWDTQRMSAYTCWWILCLCNKNGGVRTKHHDDRSWCNSFAKNIYCDTENRELTAHEKVLSIKYIIAI